MLQLIDVDVQRVNAYADTAGSDAVAELRELAAPLRGRRVAHINSTHYGGGVSELLRSLVALYRGLGIDAEWRVIRGDERFFRVTKDIHNALQGAAYDLTGEAREIYLMHSRHNAGLLDSDYDYIIIHDPQPLAMRHFCDDSGAKWVWRCHIDTSQPNPEVLSFLRGFIVEYDALVFTMPEFVPNGLQDHNVAIISPGIDPLSPKNIPMSEAVCRSILHWAGVDPNRPLMTQVSRFDPWKDPLGVIEVFQRVRRQVPGLQLALLGSLALDDPQGWEMYNRIIDETYLDPDIHVATNITGVSNMEVNAFQRHSSVVIQKSIREGFGLVVSETLWKGTPVVAGRAGGIPLQMTDGIGGFLIGTTDECVERALYLLQHPEEARRIGLAGQQRVREQFLITRLAADELRLLHSL